MSEARRSKQQRPFVFVTGPYRTPTEEGIRRNIEEAVRVGRAVFEKGYYPIVPHVLVREYWNPEDTSGLFGYEPLMQYTLALVGRCDILLLYGHSPGADREWKRAEALGKRIYFEVGQLPDLATL
jgi:hypothetical protein